MGSAERRRFERLPIELKIEYKKQNTFFYDYTHNISKGGTFIATEKPLAVGTRFTFKLSIPGVEHEFNLTAEVMWVRTAEAARPAEGTPAGMGIKFLSDEDSGMWEFEAAVKALMEKNLGERLTYKLLDRK
ncbi:MAG: TIGR02266 family protein [Deltaproteobacteria bacterium]|nr:TIGR02266 family protein [Deltaproteobacteria bacterium]